MNNKLIIRIFGEVNTGKTTVAKIIEEALKQKGFTDIEFVDPFGEEFDASSELQELRIKSIKDKTSVKIEQLQTRRDGYFKDRADIG